jgi:hypothetical protein
MSMHDPNTPAPLLIPRKAKLASLGAPIAQFLIYHYLTPESTALLPIPKGITQHIELSIRWFVQWCRFGDIDMAC